MSADPYAELKQRARDGWAASEYDLLAERLLPAARELRDACAVSAGQEVLDVACGNGNLAILAAEEGAAVTGVDLTPKMLERARERAAAAGVEVDWVEGDAEELPFADESFDCAASVFGAFLAPRPDRVSAELFRVVRPGGTVGMANWAPHGFQRGLFDLMNRYSPPTPDGVPETKLWGMEDVVRERFEGLAASISIEPRAIPWRFDSFEAMVELYAKTSPRSPAAQGMSAEQQAEMLSGMRALVDEHNRADDGSVDIDAPYIVVVARKRG